MTLGRPDGPGSFWRRAWVDAVGTFAQHGAEAFRVSQVSGRGLLIYESRDWDDYRVSPTMTVHLGCGGLAARVQGMRRYYAFLLRAGAGVLVKVLDRAEKVLATTDWSWQVDVPIALALEASGSTIRGRVEGEIVLEADNADRPLGCGALALAVETGTVSAGRVSVVPLGQS